MKSKEQIRNAYKIKQMVNNVYCFFKKPFLFLLFVYFLGILLGAIVCARRSDSIEIENLFDGVLIDFLSGDKSGIALCFTYIFINLVIIAFFIFFNFKPIMCGISAFIVFVCAYLFGFNITAIIITFGFAGILNSIIIIIPLTFFADMVMVFICAINIKRNLLVKKFGNVCLKNCNGINYLKLCLFLTFIEIMLIIIKCLLLPIIKITIIINS